MNIVTQNKSIVAVVLAAALVLFVPLAGMVTEEWGWFDFAAIAVLLLGAGLLYEVASRISRKIEHKAIVAAAVAVVVFVVWVELAVGLFGSPVAGS